VIHSNAEAEVALAALEHVISISRVEMYKPIQIAEVLYRLRTKGGFTALELDKYKNPSKAWRDQVTDRLMGKHSTSTAQFQNHLWGPSAMPPEYLLQLDEVNRANAEIEKRIYKAVFDKQVDLIGCRNSIISLISADELEKLFSKFADPALVSSRDRLFEIIVSSVLQAALFDQKIFLSVLGFEANASGSLGAISRLVSSRQIPLQVARLGRTNAADAGIDVWTNFGVLVNVKHRLIDRALIEQIILDTPKGELLIVCLGVTQDATDFLAQASHEREITFLTLAEIWDECDNFVSSHETWKFFKAALLHQFDEEFPMALTLTSFLEERGYIEDLVEEL
jgi:type II restriction enzyme